MAYIIFAILTILCLWWLLNKLPPQWKKVTVNISIIILLFTVILILLRASPYAAVIAGAITTAYIIINRLLTAWSFYRWVKKISPNNIKSNNDNTTMTPKEAADILGVSIDASEDEILKSYKILIKKNHPDTGGTTKLAEHINLAKDTLLKNREHDKGNSRS